MVAVGQVGVEDEIVDVSGFRIGRRRAVGRLGPRRSSALGPALRSVGEAWKLPDHFLLEFEREVGRMVVGHRLRPAYRDPGVETHDAGQLLEGIFVRLGCG